MTTTDQSWRALTDELGDENESLRAALKATTDALKTANENNDRMQAENERLREENDRLQNEAFHLQSERDFAAEKLSQEAKAHFACSLRASENTTLAATEARRRLAAEYEVTALEAELADARSDNDKLYAEIDAIRTRWDRG